MASTAAETGLPKVFR